MHDLRVFPIRIVLASLVATLLLPACGSSRDVGVAQPPLTFGDEQWVVTVRNHTDRYVWLTRYWTTEQTHGWHIEGANCIAPHGEITEAIYYTLVGGNSAQLRAEIKPETPGRKDCSGDANDADVWSYRCPLPFSEKDGYLRALAEVIRDDSQWQMKLTKCWGA